MTPTLPAVIAATVACGVGCQQWAEHLDRRRLPAPGQILKVECEELHVTIEGSGPAVLIDSGLGGSSIEWGPVARELSRDFTVIRYDRPGFAWSPASTRDRTPLRVAQRIGSLLGLLGIDEPVIFVGHSLGGLHVLVTAALYPHLVSGLVLVDPSHQEMLDALSQAERRSATIVGRVLKGAGALAPVGVGRLAGRVFARLGAGEIRQPLDAEQRQLKRQTELLTLRTGHGLRATAAEMLALPDSLREVTEILQNHPLPKVPLTVITASAPGRTPRETEARRTIGVLHGQHVTSTPIGRQVAAERSGHIVPLDQPEVIVSCVRETASAALAGAW